jgi:twitching motility protein PilT
VFDRLPKKAGQPFPTAAPTNMAWIDALFERMVQSGASDLHMTSTLVPMFRLHGDMVPVQGCPVITPEQMQTVLFEIAPADNKKEFGESNDTDFAYELPGQARFRANLFRDHRGPGGVFRQIPSKIASAEQLGLPKAIIDLCHLSKGLVLVTGPTGSGKSTTLAAMIDHINESRAEHIITIEDPIEFVHPSKRCLVNQREVHKHTGSFKRALRAALREDPDIVLVGEMRDLETIEIAIETAETGHLVFGTLHTTTAASTVDRIIDQFPADRQSQIRTMLASSLKGVVAQTLLKKNGGGRVAGLEILIVNNAIGSNIREGKTHQIPSAMQMGGKLGMRLMNDALFELVKSKTVDPVEAYLKAVHKEDLLKKCQSAGIVVDMSKLGAEGEGLDTAHGQAPAGNGAMHAGAHAAPSGAAHAAPHGAPHAAPHGAPHASPHGAPHASPYAAPHASPHAAPHAAPHGPPQAPPHAAPDAPSHGTPHAAPHAPPPAAPHAAPHGTPTAVPYTAPRRSPNATPSSIPYHASPAAPRPAPSAVPHAPASSPAPSAPARPSIPTTNAPARPASPAPRGPLPQANPAAKPVAPSIPAARPAVPGAPTARPTGNPGGNPGGLGGFGPKR